MFGELLVDGMPPDRKFNRKVAYIPKEDISLPMLTVRETLMFALNLRLPHATVSPKEKKFRLQAALELLGLTHTANTVVGDAITRGISGGERRRVSIAVEVICGHRLVIADSPTNGLDSAAALSLIRTARAITKNDHLGGGFMASIMQPSPELLELFDVCCVMSRGRCIFWGPTGDAAPFFLSQGFEKPPSKSDPDFLEELSGNPWTFIGAGGILLQAALNSGVESEPTSPSHGTVGLPGTKSQSAAKNKDDPDQLITHNLQTHFRDSDYYSDLGMAIWEQMTDYELSEEDASRKSRRCLCCLCPSVRYVWTLANST